MKLAVLVSGSGTNLKAMIDRQVPITMVLADKECRGLEIAREAGIPTELIDRRRFGYRKDIKELWDRKGFTMAVVSSLQRYGIELVAMAGFFTIFHKYIFHTFTGEVLNSHPARLPDFPGETAVADTLAAMRTSTVSTIIIATEIVDDPRFIVATTDDIPVYPDRDTVDELWNRIKPYEWELYPRVLLEIMAGQIDLDVIRRQPA
jgi:phosphoribosylglycinamide formyltransferase 1